VIDKITKAFDITKLDTGYTGKKLNKEKGKVLLAKRIEKLAELQYKFYADGRRSLLIIIQGLDAAGKDSTVRKVFSGINPQGVDVISFKQPTHEELRHDFLWRCVKNLPEQGKWTVFNRSYYEEVLAVKVHPEFLAAQHLPPEDTKDKIWKNRYEDINNFERFLTRNGVLVIKFFLNVSSKEQAKRFIERANEAEKNWKMGIYDLEERALRPKYMDAINEMVQETNTEHAPWNVIPADDKWYSHLIIADSLINELEKYDMNFPKPDAEQLKAIREVKKKLGKDVK
jgi:PPK2 family polyphosphate:nucleotide phosphotransferase